MHIACRLGSQTIVEYLLLQGMNIETRNKQLQTGLHVACKYGMEVITESLLKQGADMMARDSMMRIPFHYACCSNSSRLIVYLLQNDST